ncbi:AEC family transporter [Desulfurispira natronophila]|uniref:AEC family transporter n=1 Tax=Desulfurispira natronophila TaxID=682562 RepID=A0A7W8DH05_9BACT|nr:AEC family transporter [Desulfurispira natronophila]MBB5022081.1 hypothetical protein [Desulfurispira natronophila]
MAAIFSALFPVFALIVLGYLLRARGFPGDAFWPLAERITYFIFFPALIFSNLYQAPLEELSLLNMVATLALATTMTGLVLVVLRRPLGMAGPAFTSVFQGGVRFNTFVGIAAAAALLGDAGLTFAAIAMATLIPLVNVLCVFVLLRHSSDERNGLGAVLLALLKNPLILACIMGISFQLLSIPMPHFGIATVEALGRASLPIGLLAVGAGLQFSAITSSKKDLAISSVVKLIFMPLTVAALGVSLGLQGDALVIVVLFAALPTAPSAYILARQLGGDTTLMASIITIQTALAALTLPVVLSFLL